MKKNIDNAIIVRSKTHLEQLTERFNTQEQAKFYITQSKQAYKMKKSGLLRKQDMFQKGEVQQQMEIQQEIEAPELEENPEEEFKMYDDEHKRFYKAFDSLQKSLSGKIKFKVIQQDFLPSYIFSDNDLVIVIGQDGLVANTAKYVHGIPIIAINPDPERYDGVLLPFSVQDVAEVVNNVVSGNYNFELVTMAETELNDGQKLLAFNDFFIGPSNHTSARYEITFGGRSENHSSSGVIVSTGAGSTGWLSSLFNMANSIHQTFGDIPPMPYQPIPKSDDKLVFVVREPFLSKTSQINITSGMIYQSQELTLESHMPQNGVIFSDGIQTDFLKFNSGAIATIRIADVKAKLVLP